MPEANYATRVFRAVEAESPGLPPELTALYALLALVKGDEVSLQDVHDAWSVWRQATAPDHRSLVPFGDLTREVQELDRPYMEAIHRAGKETPDA